MYFYQVNVVYERQISEDNPGEVKENYLVEAMTCSDAEKQVLNEIKPYLFGECETPQIRKRLFFDIFPDESKEQWFEAKVELITIEDNGKEARRAVKMLIQADDIYSALKELKYEYLTAYDCEIISIAKSQIVDIIKNE